MSIMWVDKQRGKNAISKQFFSIEIARRKNIKMWYVDVFTIENELLDATGGEEGKRRVDNCERTMEKLSETVECKLKSRRIIIYNF